MRENKRKGSSTLLPAVFGLIAVIAIGAGVWFGFTTWHEKRTERTVAAQQHDLRRFQKQEEKRVVSEEEYDALQREIAEEEARLERLRSGAKKSKKPTVQKLNRKKSFERAVREN